MTRDNTAMDSLTEDAEVSATTFTHEQALLALLSYYEATNRIVMREFERSGRWSEAASESRRFEEQQRYAWQGQDPLQDQR